MTQKKILVTSNVVLLLIIAAAAYRYGWLAKITHKMQSTKQVPQNAFAYNPTCEYSLDHYSFHYIHDCDTPSIIMFGNSLISRGNWQQLLSREDINNRGIAGDMLPCLCKRLKYLKNKNAKIWFIEAGINDLQRASGEQLLDNYKEIVDFVKAENSIPVIVLINYLSKKVNAIKMHTTDYRVVNHKIKELNTLVIKYAQENNLDYIDLNPFIASDSLEIKDEYTTDGLHLSAAAYLVWAREITTVLKKYGI